ncbi:hypothetical protein ACFSEO_00385 [Agromyces cerinus subsp. nitratus]|uniref:hypothetical protein n=1 Tax=Agromyces cerinus TaxID=33878 RepID=UPI0036337F87
MTTTTAVRNDRQQTAAFPRGRSHHHPSLPAQAIWLLLLPFLVLFVFSSVVARVRRRRELLHREAIGAGIGGERRSRVRELCERDPEDGICSRGFGRVLVFGIVQVPLMLIVALALALAVDALKGNYPKFVRLSAFLPYAVPG